MDTDVKNFIVQQNRKLSNQITNLEKTIETKFKKFEIKIDEKIETLAQFTANEFRNVHNQPAVIEDDVSILKFDVNGLKKDVHALKDDIVEVKASVRRINEIDSLRERIIVLKKRTV